MPSEVPAGKIVCPEENPLSITLITSASVSTLQASRTRHNTFLRPPSICDNSQRGAEDKAYGEAVAFVYAGVGLEGS